MSGEDYKDFLSSWTPRDVLENLRVPRRVREAISTVATEAGYHNRPLLRLVPHLEDRVLFEAYAAYRRC